VPDLGEIGRGKADLYGEASNLGAIQSQSCSGRPISLKFDRGITSVAAAGMDQDRSDPCSMSSSNGDVLNDATLHKKVGELIFSNTRIQLGISTSQFCD
jgi:hypothetical protein